MKFDVSKIHKNILNACVKYSLFIIKRQSMLASQQMIFNQYLSSNGKANGGACNLNTESFPKGSEKS